MKLIETTQTATLALTQNFRETELTKTKHQQQSDTHQRFGSMRTASDIEQFSKIIGYTILTNSKNCVSVKSLLNLFHKYFAIIGRHTAVPGADTDINIE